MEMHPRYYMLMLVVIIVVTFPSVIRGAPPYLTRQLRQEPASVHSGHLTLCWTVKLNPPLHFQVAPVTADADEWNEHDSVSPTQNRPYAAWPFGKDSLQHQPAAYVSASVVLMSGSANSSEPKVVYAKSGTGLVGKEILVNSEEMSSGLSSSDAGAASSGSDEEHSSGTHSPNSDSAVGNNPVSGHLQNREQLKDALLNVGTKDHTYSQFQAMQRERENSRQQKAYVYHQVALQVAMEVGLRLLGKVGELYEHFVMCYEEEGGEDVASKWSNDAKAFQQYYKAHRDLKNSDAAMFEDIQQRTELALGQHHDVAWFSMETVHSRQKRSMTFNDPAYKDQWHLVNDIEVGMDINVTGVWKAGITGADITVAVVDDGLEWNNPDLQDNYNFLGSWDLNDNDPDPMPDGSKVTNHHGTRCAGEIAAVANNEVCGVGVAYGSKVAGIRLLDGPMTDSLEAEAFNKKFDINAVYSCSWGPDDDGRTVDGPHLLAAKAMKYGVDYGRHGYGSVFVVASGNGGSKQDNCNYDGYANSIYTVTIGAVDDSGAMPYYAEECASMLGVTFSSGLSRSRDIVTTDWQHKGGTGCTDRHTGTSAAAPLAAGMIALMLDAQPCLTWRDVQYLIIITSVKIDREKAHYRKNGAGLEHSHKHGFGLISAWRLVNAARVWRSVPWMTSYSEEDNTGWVIPRGLDDPLTIKRTVTSADIAGYSLYMLEYVQVTVTLSHPVRGKLGIHLRSPSGTVSVIGAPRPNDNSTDGFTDWTFTSVRCWGEHPTGDWTLVIIDYLAMDSFLPMGKLVKWRLTLFGTPMTTSEFQERRQEVEAAMGGQYMRSNFTPQCDPPPVTSPPYIPLSEKTLKILFLASVFCVLFALYETLEYMLCYGDEKQQHAEELERAMTQRRADSATNQSSSETALLLGSDAQLDSDWLRETQSAFEEGDDDMFLWDAGIAARVGQARRSASRAGERIPLSTLRSSAQTYNSRSHEDDSLPLAPTQTPDTSQTAPQPDAMLSSLHSVNTGSSPAPHHEHQTSSTRSGQDHSPTESCTETIAGPPKNSILPDMWRSLTQDSHSDSESGEDELFQRGRDESSVSLLHSGGKKSLR